MYTTSQNKDSDKRKLILIADDEKINRSILGSALSDDYDVIYTTDGAETLNMIKEKKDDLALVLLDLIMPGMNGLDILKELQNTEGAQNIPIIVLTSDHDAEVESLSIGAVDFIPKPYPSMRVIRARIKRTIELFEDRHLLSSMERDALTGVYKKDFFFKYADLYDQKHPDKKMDAVIIDISHFHIINERFGSAYGNRILRTIGENLHDAIQVLDGIVCRKEADTFMIYCPHGTDYNQLLKTASEGLYDDGKPSNRIRLRMGIYMCVDKSIDMSRRFDRAKLAADTKRNIAADSIGVYDDAFSEAELYKEKLIEDFHDAIETKQFEVFYQPKFDITKEPPVLSSAEALVRWNHPTLGLISPSEFVPLFEENGLINELDRYVWQTAADQLKAFKDKLGTAVPVSVNVSRIDLFDPDIADTLERIVKDNGLDPHELMLEITESAYADDSERIIKTVNELRDKGFKIEMDDFGTGYSSLNSLSTLPIDVLKMDMSFLKTAFQKSKDTRILEFIVDIANYLSVPVIAEGVETLEQLEALKELGCDLVQGYYFSKPIPANEFEKFLTNSKSND